MNDHDPLYEDEAHEDESHEDQAHGDDARTAILGAVRRALHRDGAIEAGLARTAAARVDGTAPPPQHPHPLCDGDLAQRLGAKLQAVQGTVDNADDDDAVVTCIRRYLQQNDPAPRIVMATDPQLAHYPWHRDHPLDSHPPPAGADDTVSITPAFAGIAETGTIALISGPQTPATLNFLPPTHIVVLAASRIRAHIEEVWTMLRALPAPPRALCFVTGPSRTADVEQTLQVGAHGPIRFHLVIDHGR